MMPDKIQEVAGTPAVSNRAARPLPARSRGAGAARQLRSCLLVTLGLLACFAVPLTHLFWLAVTSDFSSYILLIPFISLYLLWQKRLDWPRHRPANRRMAAILLGGGVVAILMGGLVFRSHPEQGDEFLTWMIAAFVLFILGNCAWFLGAEFLRANVFPLGFLAFMVPLPAVVINGIDSFLQDGSAVATREFFNLSGTPFLEDGRVFQLPGITLQIAPECSGIHSTMVLFLTSLLASYSFLRTPWKRAVFILAVIPLGILRNGFRVFTIGELCVHRGPEMINSPIHHKGGPIFFLLSLIPLFVLLVVLQRSDRTRVKSRCELL